MIYFVQEKGLLRNRVKIGFTENASERLRNLQGQCPSTLRLVFILNGSEQEESKYHRAFAGYRLHGEWFRYGLRLRLFILFIWLNRFMAGELFKPAMDVKLPQSERLPQSAFGLLSNGLLELVLEKLVKKYPKPDLLQYLPDNPDKFDAAYEEHNKIIKKMESQKIRDWMRQTVWSPSGPQIIFDEELE